MKYKKTILTIAVFIGAIPLALYLGLLYLYHHPSTLINLIESALHERTGLSIAIDKLQWSHQPLQLMAENIHVSPSDNKLDFEARIARFKILSRISGPFGHRILKIESIQLEDFSARLSSRFTLKTPEDKPGPTGLPMQVLQWLTRVFIFERVQIERIDLSRGNIRVQAGAGKVHLSQIEGSTDRLKAVNVSGAAEIKGLPSATSASVPDWQMEIRLDDLNAIAGRLSIPIVTFSSSLGTADRVTLEARVNYNRRDQKLELALVRLESPEMDLHIGPEDALRLGPIKITTAGIYDLARNHLHLSDWELLYLKTLNAKGQADIQLKPGVPTRILISEGHLVSENLQHLLVNKFNLNLPVSLSGPLDVTGRIEKTADAQAAHWETTLVLVLKDNRFDFSQPDTQLQGMLSGDIQVDGILENLHIKARLRSRQTVSAGRWWKTEPFETKFILAVSHPAYVIQRLEADLPQISLSPSDRLISLRQIKIEMADGKFDIKSGNFSCPGIQLSSQRFKNLKISISGRPEAGRIRLESADSGLLAAALTFDLLPSGWSFGAHDTLSSTLEWQGSEPIIISATGKLGDLQFFNADESCLGENLSLNATVRTALDITDGSLSAIIGTSVDQGEILCGKYYFDLAANRFTTDGRGLFRSDRRTVQISELRFEIANLLMLFMHGTINSAGDETETNLSVRLMPADLNTLFKQLLQEPYQYELPTLNDLQLGGSIRADLSMRQRANRWAVKGRTQWKAGHLSMPSRGLELKAIHLDLPIWYLAGLEQPQQEPLSGRLSVKKMRVPFIAPQPLEIDLRAEPNRIRIDKETRLLLKPGEIILGPVDLYTPHRQAPELRTNLKLTRVPADTWLKNLWENPPKGFIRGQLHTISFVDRNLIGEGTLEADLFGGQIQMTDPSVVELLSAAPAVRLNVGLDSLNLAEMTAGTPFGRIEGLLSGYIRDLEVVRGEPQHFDLRLETVKTKGVPQRINVKAVENIARLGGGQSPFIGFAGTFAAMFKAFPYKKIGMAATLNNDVFTINGTIRENGIEYLVRRSGLSGVDVVNLNPDNRISFKDMIKRIQRIKGSKGGPVIR